MAVISLAEAELLRNSPIIPVQVRDGTAVEPWFDYDDEGNPRDFGIDVEPSDPTIDQLRGFDTEQLLYDVSPSEFAETAIRIPEAGRVSDFDFTGREYLRRIYDTPAKKVLLVFGRQSEKSLCTHSLVSLANGRLVPASEVKVGDEVLGMNPDGSHTSTGRVTWVSRRYRKPCIRIGTRQRHSLDLATTHPLRSWGRWESAGSLTIGSRVAVVREGGIFTGKISIPRARIGLTALLIGDGYLGATIRFTKAPGLAVDEVQRLVQECGGTTLLSPVRGKKSVTVGIHTDCPIKEWLAEDGLLWKNSPDRFIPDWVFDLTREETSFFLNRLWATDGHVKQKTRSQYSLDYCSTSKLLVRQLQALLWKFGIPSRIRRNWPNYWKAKGIKKYAWILSIETQGGVYRFLTQISALGKGGDVQLPMVDSNNNQDTYPVEINDLIREIITSRSLTKLSDSTRNSLHSARLRPTLKYPPTIGKLLQYIDYFQKDCRCDQQLVQQLDQHVDTDLYWDRITSVEDLGEQECIDFTVETQESFAADGFITHNSTSVGNRLLCYSCLNNNFKCLYVSPSAEQSKVFSNDRLKGPIENSPLIAAYTTHDLNQAVFFKKLINFSQIRLRYAYLTADRVRGIASDLIAIDELQDILIDNIPIIEQCAFHSPYKLFVYSGTPKSMDNTIEHYWSQFSTRNEWVIPCERHGTPNNPSSWHWNVLGENNIGKEGLICDRCSRPITARHPQAQWVSMNPMTAENKEKITFEGYRVPQIMVPWVYWPEILEAREQYTKALFYNEKLGLSYDSGIRPISRAHLKKCCKDHIRLTDIEAIRDIVKGRDVSCGIDWGSDSTSSYTVISFGTYLGTGNFSIFYIHRFTGLDIEPDRQLDLISQMVVQMGTTMIGVDYGGGFHPNSTLIKRFGPQRVIKYQYNPRQKKKIYWEPNLQRYMCHRSEVMSDIFGAFRRQLIDLPCWEDFRDPYGQDILNIFTEYNERLRMNEYKKAPGATDDAFHSILLCALASMIRHPRPDIIIPDKETGVPMFHG